MNLRFILILCMGMIVSNLWAQYVPMDIPLVKNGNLLKNPWAGGLNLPQFSTVDLNNDGIEDIVAYDREGAVAATFLNGGSPGVVDYTYAPEYMKHLPQKDCENFMLFRDYNCDGIKDIFGMYQPWGMVIGVAVWKGSYDANDTIQYTLVENQLRYDVSSSPFDYQMGISQTDLPAIDDVDGDGDLDILAFTEYDVCFLNNVFWYKNMSVENGHNCDSLEFLLESECWGLFEERGDSNKVNMSPSTDSCYNNSWFNLLTPVRLDRIRATHSVVSGSRGPRHSGANTTIVDFNGDNVADMALGGVTFKNINMVSGVSINDTILITTQDYHYPVYDEPVDIYTFPAAFFLDVNNDGLTDMLAAPSETGEGEAVMDSVAWYYQNTGSNSNMIFDFQQKDFLVGEMLDVGYRAFPALFDHNADGLMDILIGGFGRCQDGGAYDYGMTLLENAGTLTEPAFKYVTNNYMGTDSLSLNGLYPTFGDLDGDNDLDMICGAENGTLIYFENTGGAGNLVAFAAPALHFAGIDVGDDSTPFLIDLDRDGDLDLVVGQSTGTIHYYKNGGTATNPVFSPSPSSTNLGGYSVLLDSPMPFVYDHNGAYELYIGHYAGNIIHLGNIDANIMGTYDTLSENFNNFYQGSYTHISVADLDNDNKLDYILGTGRGGLMIMAEKDTILATTAVEVPQKVVHLYPNPAQDELTISFLEANDGPVAIQVYNALGQMVLQTHYTAQNAHQYQLDVSKLSSGVLFLDIKTKDYHEVVRFVKC